MLGEVAGGAGSVDEERDDCNEQEPERRAVGLAAALTRNGPDTAEVERRKETEKR